MENYIDYKTDFVVTSTKQGITSDRTSKILCKVIKFSSAFNLLENLNKISTLNPNDFPCLLIFSIEVKSLNDFQTSQIQNSFFNRFDKTRPIILQIKAKTDNNSKWFYRAELKNQFVDIEKEQNEDTQLSQLLYTFSKNNRQRKFEDFTKTLINDPYDKKYSSTTLRFLLTLNLSEKILLFILEQSASKGSETEISALLNASLEIDFRIFNTEVQKLLSENASILKKSISNQNREVAVYLISNYTHLIQELSYDDRIEISDHALQKNNIEVLCKLLEFSDFPFPNNIDVTLVENQRLRDIISERKSFHKAISGVNLHNIKAFIVSHQNLKFVFNTRNKSALAWALECKHFKIFVDLKSYGFKSKDNEIDDIVKNFEEIEDKELKKQIDNQTKRNVGDARPDPQKIILQLRSRSLIHKRIITKEEEKKCRMKIKNIFENVNDVRLCSKFLHVASQCEDLKIIFDFDSESVENINIKSGPHASGMTYPKSKWIFLGAKETQKNTIKKIEGVLMHEIGHYVMRLVYENNEKPYYKNDETAKDEFGEICKKIDKWSSNNKDENNENENNESSFESLIYTDDKCNGIISSVFIDYKPKEFHLELIVRPLQILAQFSSVEFEEKLNILRTEYYLLFKFLEKSVQQEFKNFNLSTRKSIKKFNRMFGDWLEIKNKNYKFENTRDIEKVLKSHFKPILSNIPILAICNIFQCIQNQNLPKSSNIFISSETLKKRGVLGEIKSVLCDNMNATVIVDGSKELNGNIKKLYDHHIKLVVVVGNRDQLIALEELILGPNANYRKTVEELNYSFDDLTIESQRNVIQKNINFQNNLNVSLEEIITNKKTVPGDAIDKNLYKHIISDQFLKLLLEDPLISINANPKDRKEDKYFDILYQPRNLINKTSAELVTENDLLASVTNMKNILISDLGGTGKTWMLKRFANIVYKQTPNNWVTYIDLKHYIETLNCQKTILRFSHFIYDKILKLRNNYEIQIFNLLYKNGRVTILCDGFDEVSQDCATFLINLFKSFERNNGNQLWIATRNYCEDTIIKEIQFDAIFNLNEFNEDNGTHLVICTWLLHEDPNIKGDPKLHPNYSRYKKLVKEVGAKLPKKASRSIGFPLFYKMIANVYINNKDLIDFLTVYEIVQNIVTQQCRRWMSEKGEPGIEAAIESQNKNCGYFLVHQCLALRSLFPAIKRFCNIEIENHKWSDSEINNCGLATKDGDVICFQHETIREFFVAMFVLRILNEPQEYKNDDFVAFLKDLLANYKLSVIRTFINDGLQPNTIISNENFIENLINQSDCDYLTRVFKEGHLNIIKMFMALSPEKSRKVVKILSQSIKVIIEVVQSNDTLEEIFYLIINKLTDDDLMNLFLEQEVFQNFVKLRSDVTILENIAEMLKQRLGEDFVRKSLEKKCLVNSNMFYFLFDSDYFDVESFKILFLFLQKYYKSNEIVKMIKQNNNEVNNILHACIKMKNEKILEKMWKVIQNICDHLDNLLSFKDLVVQNGSILHSISSFNDERLHKTLWKLILQTYQNPDEFKNLVFHKDDNEFSFLHLLIKSKNLDTLKCALIHILGIPSKEILNLKDPTGKNLLHFSISLCKSDKQIHKVLWNYIKNHINDHNDIKKLLLDVDNEQNNSFELMALHSSKYVFTYIIQEIYEILGDEELIIILKSLNKQNKNLLQIAARYNFDLEFHEQLWKVLNKHLDLKEMLDIVHSTDVHGYTLLMIAVLYNNQNCVELTWNEISNYIKGKVQRHEYLNKIGQDGMSLMELSRKNKHENVTLWIGELFNKVTISGPPYGKSVNLLQFEGNDGVKINIVKLKTMLLHEEVRERQIVAFSVTGALRKGKSSFLNYCLRFLYAHYPSINFRNNPVFKKNDWIGLETEALKGFSWRSGLALDTKGIMIWDDVFLHTDEAGQKIAVIVIDSQGLFDHETSQQNNSKIFAIETLISSIQVFNISMQFENDQLQELQLAADYAQFPKSNNQRVDSKGFQSLLFLVRDWPNQDEYEYGIDGGEKYLNNFLSTNKNIAHANGFIHNSFECLSCWLLPHPGNIVTVGKKNQPDYDGNHKEMNREFKTELIKVIEHLLNPRNLKAKKINNELLTSAKYLKYVETQLEKFFQANF